MTVEFVILPDLFEIKCEKKEEYPSDLVRYFFHYVHPQLKGFVLLSNICFNYSYFIENYHPRIILVFSMLLNIPRSIISLSVVRHTLDVTDRMPYFTCILTHVRILLVLR